MAGNEFIFEKQRHLPSNFSNLSCMNVKPADIPVNRYDTIKYSSSNRKTSTTPQNKSRKYKSRTKQPKSGIKPFLCLKGKLKIDSNSPKAPLTMKDKIKKFEAKKDKPTEKDYEVEDNVSKMVKPKSEKIKLISRVFENNVFENSEKDGPFAKKTMKDDNVDTNEGVVKVINAFEMMMNHRCDTQIKTPRSKKIGKKSTRLSEGKIGRKKF